MTLYLYALVDRHPRDNELGRGLSREPLSIVRAGKVLVVVERRRTPLEATPRAIVGHDRIVRRIAKLVPTVLPLRFGTTAPDRAALETLLGPIAGSVARAFERVHGAVQFTLRVSGRQAPPVIPRRVGPGTRWLAERIARQQVPEIAVVTEATRPYVRESRAERSERGTGRGASFASVYHLVAREDVRSWRKALARSIEELPADVRVTTTGPWPPYAFAELA